MPTYKDVDAILRNLPDDLPYKASVKRVLIQAPEADVVEVVRCRDCKYSIKTTHKPYDAFPYLCRKTDEYHADDYYCRCGERRV